MIGTEDTTLNKTKKVPAFTDLHSSISAKYMINGKKPPLSHSYFAIKQSNENTLLLKILQEFLTVEDIKSESFYYYFFIN